MHHKSKAQKAKLSQEQIDEIREAFDLFDKDGNGTISTDELKFLFKCFNIKKTKSEIKEIIKINDKDHSGELDFNEFVSIMNSIILISEAQ